jgi:hypothetical protein
MLAYNIRLDSSSMPVTRTNQDSIERDFEHPMPYDLQISYGKPERLAVLARLQ